MAGPFPKLGNVLTTKMVSGDTEQLDLACLEGTDAWMRAGKF